jgi:hypothetical protein
MVKSRKSLEGSLLRYSSGIEVFGLAPKAQELVIVLRTGGLDIGNDWP